MSIFTVEVSYAQLAVFDARLVTPFNDWSDAHVGQGFSWRPGSVSFATLDTSGPMTVRVDRSGAHSTTEGLVERAIRVPFTVPAHREVEISTISETVSIEIEGGAYALTFCHGRTLGGAMWASLVFEPAEAEVKPAILRADGALIPPAEFLMNAEGA